MEKITKNELLKLGFIENYVTPEESGSNEGFFYFSFEIDGHTLLITNDNVESNGVYSVEFFNFYDTISFNDLNQLKTLINLVNDAKKIK